MNSGSAFAWPSAFFRGFRPLQVIISPRCVASFAPILSGQACHLHGSTEPDMAVRGRLDRNGRLATSTPWLSPLPPSPHVTVLMKAPAPACPRTSRETLRRRKRADCRRGLGGRGRYWVRPFSLPMGGEKKNSILADELSARFYAREADRPRETQITAPKAWLPAPRSAPSALRFRRGRGLPFRGRPRIPRA
ncbi:Hypothetical protein RG1141_CH25000 [Neorhizobium galegae bv. officinalis bv. officinalis str. HAMBI 1141]|uniref:Uncharacterized protein n=1 Tax=Neorhizobium galegae bv. officinalis bv. officinalis str. HAMBI 1141 TaxID=1028801 RepID=A0A068T8I2_NEOGA|nr:Hypothetical protein RG1141_CH25000 [Neorhizobium galegae bv. officinalis bv. officinalis str. HAMBI 1141]